MTYVSSMGNIQFRVSETVESLWDSAFIDANHDCYTSMNVLSAMLNTDCQGREVLNWFGIKEVTPEWKATSCNGEKAVFEKMSQFEKRVRNHAVRMQHQTVTDLHYLIAICDCADRALKLFFASEGIDPRVVKEAAEKKLGTPPIPFVTAVSLFQNNSGIQELSRSLEKNRRAYLGSKTAAEKTLLKATREELFDSLSHKLSELWRSR